MSELDKFKKQYLALVSRLTDQVFQLIKAGQTKDQILNILSQRDFKKVIFADKQFKNSYDDLNLLYSRALRNMDKFADISQDTLLAITKVNQSTFFDKMAIDIATSIKGNITSGILGGLTKDDIIKGIEADLRPDQIDTLVTTALSNYSASITSLMADQLPTNVSYVYSGPVDKKTRPLCLQFMSSGKMTREQIESVAPNAFIERGGFNCRHQWRLYTKQVQMFNPKGAKKEAQKRGVSISG
jgi:predicted Zn-dependent protease with MMP-like domain